jgi:hypothetical protein
MAKMALVRGACRGTSLAGSNGRINLGPISLAVGDLDGDGDDDLDVLTTNLYLN